MPVTARVTGILPWVDARRLLGPGPWQHADGAWSATLERDAAADLQARLRGVGLGGSPIEVAVVPPLKRALVRDARATDARRRRDTTPGFTRPGCRLDDEGRMSLTAESLALALGKRAAGRSVVDATGGCGGNAIGFARAGCRVDLVEPDATRLVMARHNAAIYGVTDRIRFHAGRAEDVVPGLEAELLFADPPWGEAWDRARTTPDEVPLLAALTALAARFAACWLKLPPSFDVATLPGWVPEAWFGEAEGDLRRVKFLILRRG